MTIYESSIEWKSRKDIPLDGSVIEYESVAGGSSDDSRVISKGTARFQPFVTTKLTCPLTGELFGENSTEKRWVKESTGKVVPGKIVRWRYS